MLRIAKTSPGVLDLSAVKDESGLPVTLNGPSHRDVPDHEENNPILQRVVLAQWVTLVHLPVNMPADDLAGKPEAPTVAGPPEAPVTDDLSGEPGAPTVAGASEAPVIDEPEAPLAEDNLLNAADHIDNASHVQPSDDGAMTDMPVKSEGSNRPSGKSDARKIGRRS